MPPGSLKRSKKSSSQPVSTNNSDNLKSISEEEIIKQILLGDKNKYSLLVEKYQQMIFTTCMGFLHNKDEADDLTQEIFIQAYLSLVSFKNKSTFSTWIYRIAVNASCNKIRKSVRKNFLQRLEILTGSGKHEQLYIPSSVVDNPENILIRQEDNDLVRRALDSLPENQRTAIILSRYDEMSQKEIAEIMNVTESAVESLLQRAKKSLYKNLAGNRK